MPDIEESFDDRRGNETRVNLCQPSPNPQPSEELTLDPQDWESIRELGHRMVDDMLDFMRTQREKPVWQPIPRDVREFLTQPLPSEPTAPETIYEEFAENILPHPLGNTHPRFWGWVVGGGTPLGAMAEMMAATMNPTLGGGEQVATLVELQVIDWCKQMMGFPHTASGLLVSGCSKANLIGLTVARNQYSDVRNKGMRNQPQLRVYGSKEMHFSIKRALEMLGIGAENLVLIPTDADYRVDIAQLEAAIAQDRAAGYEPLAVVGCAGTVNTGAIDDLDGLADVAERENLWFHVDGAFGAVVALSPKLKHRVKGIERADSLAFDFHKWLHVPYDVGCVLVRQHEDHLRAFASPSHYMGHNERGISADTYSFGDYGVQLSRSFRALKVWMTLREHGIEKFGRMVEQNVEQAQYLARLVRQTPELELFAPAHLNVVCFRYMVPGMDADELDAFNQELLMRLQESGVAVPTYTVLNGQYVFRVAHVNHRSRYEDFDILVEAVREIGAAILDEMQGINVGEYRMLA